MTLAGGVVAHDEPVSRLTRMIARALDAFEQDPERQDGDKAIVLIDDEDRGALSARGYEDAAKLVVSLLGHLDALLQTRGKKLAVVPMGSPEDN